MVPSVWEVVAAGELVPIVGDPITVVAGVLREPLATFLLLVAIAKAGRYMVLVAATAGLT